jgi:hypothetical protein
MNEDLSMPDRRHSLRAVDLDGRTVVLLASISKELYRCPGCGQSIPVGADHVILEYPDEDDSPAYHQHWHRSCAQTGIVRELRSLHKVPASTTGKPSRGQRRAATLKRRRER